MNINDDIFIRGFGREQGPSLPLWLDDKAQIYSDAIPDCVVIRIKLETVSWIIIVSETPNAIRTTAIGFDKASNSRDGSCDGYILHHSVPKPQKSRLRA
jgi:hypothetical protein